MLTPHNAFSIANLAICENKADFTQLAFIEIKVLAIYAIKKWLVQLMFL
jgi:hypothetical protein